ncbi:O-sialoglycoprotein endopeptidase, partial [bacterium]
RIPSVVRGMEISFSGPESHVQRLIAKGEAPAEVARAVEHCIAATIEKLLRQGIENTGIKDILLVGGVAANQYLRQRLKQRLTNRTVSARLFFAEPRFSSDNAVGTALTGVEYGINQVGGNHG